MVTSGADCLQCLVKCRGDVSSFLGQSDLLNLCERILNVKVLNVVYVHAKINQNFKNIRRLRVG